MMPFWPMRAAVASAARPKPYSDRKHMSMSFRGRQRQQTHGSKERVASQLGEIGAEAIATLSGRMLCELLRWVWRDGIWVGRVHKERRREDAAKL